MADPAAEREAADTGRPDDAGRNGPAVLLCCGVDLAELRAAADTHHPGAGVDLDGVHRREVDDEPVVDAPEPSAVVAAAADRDAEAPLAREGDGGCDVLLVDAVRDPRGMLVDHRVVEGAGLVVPRVVAGDRAPLDRRSETVDCSRGHMRLLASKCRDLQDATTGPDLPHGGRGPKFATRLPIFRLTGARFKAKRATSGARPPYGTVTRRSPRFRGFHNVGHAFVSLS